MLSENFKTLNNVVKPKCSRNKIIGSRDDKFVLYIPKTFPGYYLHCERRVRPRFDSFAVIIYRSRYRGSTIAFNFFLLDRDIAIAVYHKQWLYSNICIIFATKKMHIYQNDCTCPWWPGYTTIRYNIISWTNKWIYILFFFFFNSFNGVLIVRVGIYT